jgi:hypothetical protein
MCVPDGNAATTLVSVVHFLLNPYKYFIEEVQFKLKLTIIEEDETEMRII